MPSAAKSPAFATIARDDRGARLDHLQDLIADAADGHAGRGLPAEFHEAVAAGVMRSGLDEDVVSLTLVGRDGRSHVFALDLAVAGHLCRQLSAPKTVAKGGRS